MLQRFLSFCWIALLLMSSSSHAQTYQDYEPVAEGGFEQDNLYHDYAARQQDKAVGGGGGAGGWGKLVLGGAVGWFLGGKVHSGRIKKKLQAKHKEEQKAIYQQYYDDVYTLQKTNAELVAALEQYGARLR